MNLLYIRTLSLLFSNKLKKEEIHSTQKPRRNFEMKRANNNNNNKKLILKINR